tara:strand:+ start:2274 stop:2627 length:354 start_codon:yes stop_codon:yes gene_type:complete
MNNNKIIEKPWGQEIIWAKTKDYVGKLIFINKGHRLSRQFHKIKEETILVKTGILHIEVGSKEYKNDIYLNPGESFHVKPNVVHRFCAPFGEVLLIEVSTPELDDVVRLEDDYDRTH